MAERGIDISGHASKVYVGLMQEPWDYLVTVCDDANERCPFIPGVQLAVVRDVRDQIETRLSAWLAEQ